MINETDISRLEKYISGTLSLKEAEDVGRLLKDSKAHMEYFKFLKGLEGPSNSKSNEYDLQPTTDRIMSAVDILKSAEMSSQTWQPVLAAWAGFGIVVGMCLLLSKQKVSYLEEVGQKEIPALALRNVPSVPAESVLNKIKVTVAERSQRSGEDILSPDGARQDRTTIPPGTRIVPRLKLQI